MARSTDRGSSHGLMEAHIKENSMKIISKEEGFISGLTEGSMTAIGKIIRWRVSEYLHGLMVADMKVNTLMIRRRARAYSTGLMEENTRAIGRMANNMG